MNTQTEYAVVEHYPDGNSSIVALLPTPAEAQKWIELRYCDNCTVQKVRTTTLKF